MILESNHPDDHPVLLEIWEASVRSSHDFLSEEKILEIKQIIIEGNILSQVDLYAFENPKKEKVGFLGLSKDKIEMLFIHPQYIGKGVGRKLTEFAYLEKNIQKVEVNEQNRKAVNFYLKMGFEIVNRKPVDNMGNPFPILQMEKL
jgi:putative acetyltransferase